MVKIRDYIIIVLRLIRWPNLLIIAATQVLIRQCILVPILAGANMEPRLSSGLFTLLVISTVFIAAGGYAINDYFDRKIDRINKPGTMIVGTFINPRHAMAWHLFFTISGVLAGTYVALRIGQIYLGLIFFMVSGILWFYSTTYKRELLLGNIIVALLTALVPFIVLLFEMPLLAREYGVAAKITAGYMLTWVLGFALFAFLLNLIREIVKDTQDFEGDRAYGKSTIPVAWGIQTARYISVSLVCMVITLLVLAWLKFARDRITLVYFLLMIVIPLLYVVYLLMKPENEWVYPKVNLWLKIIMITGLGYAVVANLILNDLTQ